MGVRTCGLSSSSEPGRTWNHSQTGNRDEGIQPVNQVLIVRAIPRVVQSWGGGEAGGYKGFCPFLQILANWGRDMIYADETNFESLHPKLRRNKTQK